MSYQLPYHYATQHGVLLTEAPASVDSSHPVFECMYAALPEPAVLGEIQRFTQGSVSYSAVDNEGLNQAINAHYEQQADSAADMTTSLESSVGLADINQFVATTHDLMLQQDDAPIIKLLNALLSEAVRAGASDVHIETFDDHLAIRFRVDGLLIDAVQPPRNIAQLLVSRTKVMSKLDIAEKRTPQDGRMSVQVAGRKIDIRVSTLPTRHGERLVLRLLEKRLERLSLAHLGATSTQTESLTRALAAPHGMILVTGPTGSGKTTTLYAALSHLNDGSKNILTIEDPVEYDLNGIGQSQVNNKSDMTFARGLRAVLRQDPDVVMVGEIRDAETAEIAIQASMTGHLVLSTLHTNTAIGAVARLMDIGIPAFLLSSALLVVMAQRLVRRLCPHCKEPYTPEAADCQLFEHLLAPDQKLYHPRGCAHCNNQGYKGRFAIYEIITIDSGLRRLIHSGASEDELKDYAHLQFPDIRRDGFEKMLSGETSLAEVQRVTSEFALD